MKLNREMIEELLDDLLELNVYLPLALYTFVGLDYLEELPKKEKEQYYKHRVELMGASDYNQYLEDELFQFVKKYPQFQNIIDEEA